MTQGAGSTGAAIAVLVGVVWGIFMPFWAMGLLGHGMNSLTNTVQAVVPGGVPAQIVQAVIGGVGVWVVAGLMSRRRWTHESHQYQSMNPMSLSWIAGKHYAKSSVLERNGIQYAAMNCSSSSVTAYNCAGQRTHSAKTRNFVGFFVSDNRKPLFLHAGYCTREDAL